MAELTVLRLGICLGRGEMVLEFGVMIGGIMAFGWGLGMELD